MNASRGLNEGNNASQRERAPNAVCTAAPYCQLRICWTKAILGLMATYHSLTSFFLKSIVWIYSGTKKLKRKQLYMTMEVMRGTKRRALHLNGLWRVFIEFETDINLYRSALLWYCSGKCVVVSVMNEIDQSNRSFVYNLVYFNIQDIDFENSTSINRKASRFAKMLKTVP